jgi:hypothetical protein
LRAIWCDTNTHSNGDAYTDGDDYSHAKREPKSNADAAASSHTAPRP